MDSDTLTVTIHPVAWTQQERRGDHGETSLDITLDADEVAALRATLDEVRPRPPRPLLFGLRWCRPGGRNVDGQLCCEICRWPILSLTDRCDD